MDLVGQAENDGTLVIPKTKQGKVSYLSPWPQWEETVLITPGI